MYPPKPANLLLWGLGFLATPAVVVAVNQPPIYPGFTFGYCGGIVNFQSVFSIPVRTSVAPEICQGECGSRGAAFAAIGTAQNCFCGGGMGDPVLASSPSPNAALCSQICSYATSYACGGNFGGQDIYNLFAARTCFSELGNQLYTKQLYTKQLYTKQLYTKQLYTKQQQQLIFVCLFKHTIVIIVSNFIIIVQCFSEFG
ncbi:hypothetical protein CMUS01_10919 [Colletotrichum musicola]|uniref:WSC domain-containing protein n=1 Tax=Colletotrichum musicola TaxID=2175873 RepID=A0A8H6K1S5_9PEZI|nr:hypothetical protein CMUS01_10919 [Colletotrichum musicola]